MGSKLAKGSFMIFLGNIIFRVGGYVYRFLMATLLGPSAYGILGYTLPTQGIFQILAAGGLPPAIAKYVSEYNALEEKVLARQTIYTSLKMMIFLGLFFGLIMVFFVAPWLTVQFKEPLALYPLMAVGLITPFSVIVGAFRGAFQGVYKMEYILSTRAIEQVFMILVATALVILGLSATGAVLGSVTGFMASAALSIFIFKRYMWKYIPKPEIDYKFPIKEELNLAKKLIFFSIPVTVTALAEMGIYSICTYIIGIFLTSTFNGYFAAADPIARLPLVISISVATVILPASSEAFATKNKTLLERYVTLSYKYSLFFIIPMCIGIALFSHEIMALVYFLKPAYVLGAPSLAILVIGMSFYSLFAVSASIVQGIGNPRIPMYILIIGSGITFGLAWFFIQWWGIEGGALATTLATFIIMLPILWLTFKLTKTTVPYKPIGKIIAASAIMAIIIVLFIKIALGTFIGYQSRIGLVVGIIICPIIYLISLILLKFFTKEEINQISSYSNKLGPLSGVLNKILNIIGKYTK